MYERHDGHFGQLTPDPQWIGEIGRRGWVALTRDCRELISDRGDGSSPMIVDDATVNSRVLLDTDLASFYGVTVRRLNEQFRRNRDRFPGSFVFHLTFNELRTNWSQIVTSSKKYRGPTRLPLAFTEYGAIMAATILNSPRADGAGGGKVAADRVYG